MGKCRKNRRQGKCATHKTVSGFSSSFFPVVRENTGKGCSPLAHRIAVPFAAVIRDFWNNLQSCRRLLLLLLRLLFNRKTNKLMLSFASRVMHLANVPYPAKLVHLRRLLNVKANRESTNYGNLINLPIYRRRRMHSRASHFCTFFPTRLSFSFIPTIIGLCGERVLHINTTEIQQQMK